MNLGLLKSSRGFTYIAVLMLVVIMGIMACATSKSWTMMMKRERERELLYRGAQIRDAIAKWYKPSTRGGPPPTPLRELKDLLKDPRSLTTVRYLRKLYPDPITGKDWTIIGEPSRGIVGVASPSEEKPIKQDFTDYPQNSPEFKNFAGKKKYSEWQFDYRQIQAAQGPIPGQAPGSGQVPPNVQPEGP